MMKVISQKRGIIGEQMFMIFSLVVVVAFTIVAVKYTNGLASDLSMKQDYVTRDLSFLTATSIGAPGLVMIDYFLTEKAMINIGEDFFSVSFKDEKAELIKFLNPSKYYHMKKADFKFRTVENISQVQLLNYDNQFISQIPRSYTAEALNCMLFRNHDTKADINGQKFVIDAGRGGNDTVSDDDKNQNLLQAQQLFVLLGGQLAAGPDIKLTRNKDVLVAQEDRDAMMGNVFISLHGLDGRQNETIVINKPSRENKKMACLLSKELKIKQIQQVPDDYISNNPSPIAIVLYLKPGKYANAISGAVREYYG
jgi:hypothetical protein